MGVHREIRKMFGSSVLNYIIAARTAKGFEDAQSCSPEERAAIIHEWKTHRDEYQSDKMKVAEHGPEVNNSGYLSPKGLMQTRHLSFEERKKLHKERQSSRRETAQKEAAANPHKYCPFCRRDKPHRHTPRAVQANPVVPHAMDDIQEEFEHAIHTSVAATSRGNAEEDAMIERAIRASVRELQSAEGSHLSDQEALDRAIQASIGEAGNRPSTDTADYTREDAEHEQALEFAIQKSLLRYHVTESVDEEEEEAIKLAMTKSLDDSEMIPDPEEIDHALLEAIKQSKTDAANEKAEDDSKLEEAIKQSESHAKNLQAEDDNELEEAIKQSLLHESEGTASTSGPHTGGEGSSSGGATGVEDVGAGDDTPRGRQMHEQSPITAHEPHSAADDEALELAIKESLKG